MIYFIVSDFIYRIFEKSGIFATAVYFIINLIKLFTHMQNPKDFPIFTYQSSNKKQEKQAPEGSNPSKGRSTENLIKSIKKTIKKN